MIYHMQSLQNHGSFKGSAPASAFGSHYLHSIKPGSRSPSVNTLGSCSRESGVSSDFEIILLTGISFIPRISSHM